MKNAPAAIATMPAASPSSPSTRFTAFATATTQTIVSDHGEVAGQHDDLHPAATK